MPGGELFSHLAQRERFPEPAARFYTAEVLVALEHLHKVGAVGALRAWRVTGQGWG